MWRDILIFDRPNKVILLFPQPADEENISFLGRWKCYLPFIPKVLIRLCTRGIYWYTVVPGEIGLYGTKNLDSCVFEVENHGKAKKISGQVIFTK